MKDIKDRIIEKQDELIKHLKQYLTAFEQVELPIIVFESEITRLKSQLQGHVTTRDFDEIDKAEEEKK